MKEVDINDIIVVGGGPAGMMAAIKAAEAGAGVMLLEKNHLCGRKLAITGKGRCNITNTKPWAEFATHVHPRSNFVRSAFFNFSNAATIEYFNSIGLETVATQGDRVFPKSMNAFAVVDALVARWNGEALLEGMYPMTAEDALDLYGIDFAACLGGAAFGDADGYTNEAVIVQAEAAVLEEAEALLQDHLESVKAQFRGYDPEALALAEKAVLVREGDMLLFVISPNADAMLTAFRSLTA